MQVKHRQRDRGIELRSRLPAPGAVNQDDDRDPNPEAEEKSAQEWRCDRFVQTRARIFEHKREQQRDNHEDAQLRGLHQVTRPMLAQRFERIVALRRAARSLLDRESVPVRVGTFTDEVVSRG